MMQSQVKVLNKHVNRPQSTKLLAQMEPMAFVMRRRKLEWFKRIKENRKHQSSWGGEGGWEAPHRKTSYGGTLSDEALKAWNLREEWVMARYHGLRLHRSPLQ